MRGSSPLPRRGLRQNEAIGSPDSLSGDFDDDGDIDLEDFDAFLTCYTGPAGELPSNCEYADFDDDSDADLSDVRSFQLAFTAP